MSVIFEVLWQIVLCAFLGTYAALLSYFLDYCFYPGSIFKGYLPWLAKKVLLKNDAKEWYRITGKYESDPYELNNQVVKVCEERAYFWFKILGGCAICFNVWICFASWTLLCAITFLPWYMGLPYLLTSSFVLRRIMGVN